MFTRTLAAAALAIAFISGGAQAALMKYEFDADFLGTGAPFPSVNGSFFLDFDFSESRNSSTIGFSDFVSDPSFGNATYSYNSVSDFLTINARDISGSQPVFFHLAIADASTSPALFLAALPTRSDFIHTLEGSLTVTNVSAIPLPGPLVLLLTGLFGLAAVRIGRRADEPA